MSTIYNRAENGDQYGTPWRIQHMNCPECKRSIMRFASARRISSTYVDPKDEDWVQFYPQGMARPALPECIPLHIANDYREAARVLPISAKASAALSRRCLQAVLSGAGYTQKDLAKQIDAVLAETDTSKSLPSSVHMTVDTVRNFGNFAAHKITDQTTSQIIDVQPEEAEYSLNVLDAVFDHYYVKPAQAKAIRDALNEKLAAANKPAAK